MSLRNILKKSISENRRLDYQDFMLRVKEYLQRKNVDINAGMDTNEMKKAYEEGKYPSEFVKSYMKNQK